MEKDGLNGIAKGSWRVNVNENKRKKDKLPIFLLPVIV